MHPDSPIRQLDETIRRYGVSSVKLVPFDGGGCCVELRAKGGIHVIEGAGSLPEAIGKAFLRLMELKGVPSFDELLEASSLGTPRAKALRSSADKSTVDAILKRADALAKNPTVHWARYGDLPFRDGNALPHSGQVSGCGLVRGAAVRYTNVRLNVTCRRCQSSSSFKSGQGG